MDLLRAKVDELQAALAEPTYGTAKSFDWWALAAMAMDILKMIFDKFRPTPTPNP